MNLLPRRTSIILLLTASVLVSSRSVTTNRYVIDNQQSVVAWTGTMAFSDKGSHTGYVNISKGELIVENEQLTGGLVELDMTTIADKEHGRENGLVEHLRSPDFFDVEKFPVSTFEITHVVTASGQYPKVTGNLTIKGITHPVTFPAQIEVKNGVVNASGKLVIDRTLWDVRYKSGKFFFNLADEAIADQIYFEIKITGKKLKA
ncbi:MAG TPA: YceI family protein [Chryseosolibacter sp.]